MSDDHPTTTRRAAQMDVNTMYVDGLLTQTEWSDAFDYLSRPDLTLQGIHHWLVQLFETAARNTLKKRRE